MWEWILAGEPTLNSVKNGLPPFSNGIYTYREDFAFKVGNSFHLELIRFRRANVYKTGIISQKSCFHSKHELTVPIVIYMKCNSSWI